MQAGAIAVRLALALIGKPWLNPVTTLATPSATSSRLGSMWWPVLVAKPWPVSTVSEYATSARPMAGGSNATTSFQLTCGSISRGQLAGIGPTSCTP
jgi:hypothetical protein